MSKIKQIVFFLYSMNGGGAEKAFKMLCNQAVENKYDVILLLIHKKGVYLSDLDKNIKIKEFNRVTRRFGLFGNIVNFMYFIIKLKEPSIIISTTQWPNLINSIGGLFTKKHKICLAEQNTYTFYNAPEFYGINKLINFVSKLAFRSNNVNAIFASSSAVSDMLISNFPDQKNKITIIYNPIDIELINKKKKDPVNPFKGYDKNYFNLVAIGRLHPQKDYSTMIYALKNVLKHRLVLLHILGEGSMYSELHALAKSLGIDKYILFHGFVSNPYSYLYYGDLFVHSARFEGFGNVFIEAMACGKQIVTTDCSTPKELIPDSSFGDVVPIKDFESLSQCIIERLDNLENRNELKSNKVIKKFSVEQIFNIYEEKFSRMI